MFKKQIIWSVLLLGWLCTACQTPPPTPSPTPAELKINHFSAPTQAMEGETITVSWDVSGVEEVGVYITNLSSRLYEVPTYPAVGAIQLQVPLGSEEVKLTLVAGFKGIGDYELVETINISVTCQYNWFDTESTSHCPESEPKEVVVVYQQFEQGYIIYRPDIKAIWIFDNHNQFKKYLPEHIFPPDPNALYSSEIEFNETPPAGLEQPTGLIGTVWLVLPVIRQELGWATTPEQQYTMRVQKTPWGLGTLGIAFTLFTLPNGQTIATMIQSI